MSEILDSSTHSVSNGLSTNSIPAPGPSFSPRGESGGIEDDGAVSQSENESAGEEGDTSTLLTADDRATEQARHSARPVSAHTHKHTQTRTHTQTHTHKLAENSLIQIARELCPFRLDFLNVISK